MSAKRRRDETTPRVVVTRVDDAPGHMTAVIYLWPSEHGLTAADIAVSIAERLENMELVTKASISVDGNGGRGRAYVDVRCDGGE
jgi:hypothetical protein